MLIDNPKHASNVGSVLRQASVLQGPMGADAISAVLLSSSSPDAVPLTERFLKSALRISLAARHPLDHATRLVVLPRGNPVWALEALRAEGYVLCALENKEACSVRQGAGAPQRIWDAPLGRPERLLFLAGGEETGLSPELLNLCDGQCFIPGAECPLAIGQAFREELGQEGQNPSMNLAHAVVIALYERRRQLAQGAA